MNEIYNHIQRKNLGTSVETTDNLRPQQNKYLQQQFNRLPLSRSSHDLDGEISTDNDLIVYDADKDEFYNPNKTEEDGDFDSCGKILKAVREGTIMKCLQGVGEKLHREVLKTMKAECQRAIEDAVHEALEEAQKVKAKAVQDALKEYAGENEEYIRQLKKHHQEILEEQVSRAEQRAQEEMDKKVEDEKRACEYRVKLAMQEAQEHFREHLKTAVQEAQEKEARIGEEKFRQMKREYEEKFREANRIATEEKQKALLRQQRQLQKDHDKALQEMRKEEQDRATKQIKSQEKEYKNIITKMESKLSSMDQEIQHLAEKLKESILQKSESDAELSRLKGQLEQFLKLAAAADADTPPKHRSRSKVVIG